MSECACVVCGFAFAKIFSFFEWLLVAAYKYYTYAIHEKLKNSLYILSEVDISWSMQYTIFMHRAPEAVNIVFYSPERISKRNIQKL